MRAEFEQPTASAHRTGYTPDGSRHERFVHPATVGGDKGLYAVVESVAQRADRDSRPVDCPLRSAGIQRRLGRERREQPAVDGGLEGWRRGHGVGGGRRALERHLLVLRHPVAPAQLQRRQVCAARLYTHPHMRR